MELKLKIFMKLLQMMLKKDLLYQMCSQQTIAYRKNKKDVRLMKDDSEGNITTEFIALIQKHTLIS